MKKKKEKKVIVRRTRAKRYTKKQVLNAIDGSYGVMLNVARKLDCNWATARKYVNMWNDTKEAYKKEFDSTIDLAEKTVVKSIEEGDVFTAKWFLGLMSKKYKEKTEIDVNHTGTIKFNFGDEIKEE